MCFRTSGFLENPYFDEVCIKSEQIFRFKWICRSKTAITLFTTSELFFFCRCSYTFIFETCFGTLGHSMIKPFASLYYFNDIHRPPRYKDSFTNCWKTGTANPFLGKELLRGPLQAKFQPRVHERGRLEIQHGMGSTQFNSATQPMLKLMTWFPNQVCKFKFEGRNAAIRGKSNSK